MESKGIVQIQTLPDGYFLPMNSGAEAFAELLAVSTFSAKDLLGIKQLGFSVIELTPVETKSAIEALKEEVEIAISEIEDCNNSRAKCAMENVLESLEGM